MEIEPHIAAKLDGLPLSDIRVLAARELRRQARIAAAQVGKRHTPERRHAISLGLKRAWAARKAAAIAA